MQEVSSRKISINSLIIQISDDCRNNLDNCQFLPRCYNYFDSKVLSFVTSNLIRQEIEEKYNYSLMKLSKDDKYYGIKLSTFNTAKSESLEAADNFDKKLRDKRKKEHSIII